MVLMLAVRISECDAGCGLAHLAHGVGLEHLKAIALDHDAERGKDVVEDDRLRILGLDAFGQLRLGAADGRTQLAALDFRSSSETSAPE